MATPTNLPAAQTTGNVLTAAYVNDLRGAFRVLQTLHFETASLVQNATSTYAASGLTISITPQSTSNKILIMTSNSVAKTGTNANSGVNLRLRRGSTVLQTQIAVLYTGLAQVNIGTSSFLYLDSPNTTSATTYDVQFANYTNASLVEHQANSSASSIMVMEISA